MKWPTIDKGLLFSICLGLLGIVIYIQAQKILKVWPEPLNPKEYPEFLSVLLVITAIMNVVVHLRKNKAKQNQLSTEGAGEMESRSGVRYLPAILIAMALFYILGLTYLGFFSSTFLFFLSGTTVLAYFASEKNLWRKVVYYYLTGSVILVIVVYAGVRFFRIYLPQEGIIW